MEYKVIHAKDLTVGMQVATIQTDEGYEAVYAELYEPIKQELASNTALSYKIKWVTLAEKVESSAVFYSSYKAAIDGKDAGAVHFYCDNYIAATTNPLPYGHKDGRPIFIKIMDALGIL